MPPLAKAGDARVRYLTDEEPPRLMEACPWTYGRWRAPRRRACLASDSYKAVWSLRGWAFRPTLFRTVFRTENRLDFGATEASFSG